MITKNMELSSFYIICSIYIPYDIYNYLKWITEAEGVTALLHFYVVILIETCTITFFFYPNKSAKV